MGRHFTCSAVPPAPSTAACHGLCFIHLDKQLTAIKSSGLDACSGDPWTPLLLLRTLLLACPPSYQWDYGEQGLGPGPRVNLSVFTDA